jgi:ribonuclease HII
MSSSPTLDQELALHQQGCCFIAGLDEAGRGAWAGPVVAAAVVFPLDAPDLPRALFGLRDSKKLTPGQRNRWFERIQAVALATAVGVSPAPLVDEINVVQATRAAMQHAIYRLAVSPNHLLIDYLVLPEISLPQDSFPKAEDISLSVAAASVIAKVTRDRMMVADHTSYPAYGFDQNKGYGTPEHRAALQQVGPCPLHRLSYRPVRVLINRSGL